jgi:S-adenosylmethionine:tRNA ribosyltransferase-isomerase
VTAADHRLGGSALRDAKLLVVDALGRVRHTRRNQLLEFFRPGDLVIANDAATLPASLHGVHQPTGEPIEMRLAGRQSLAPAAVAEFSAVLFGRGDFHTLTEHRPLPPAVTVGDRLVLGPLTATVTALLGHSRLVSIRFAGTADAIWAGLARHGRPIQYAHIDAPLALWDVWTAIAGPPVAFEPPSAGFILDWGTLAEMKARGVRFATVTHAAGLSSTGDEVLDARLPLDEPYEIPETTACAIEQTRRRSGHIIAIGTTVVRALEHAAGVDGRIRSGPGLATQRLGPESRLRVVNAILTGVHERGTSHYQLLRAFVDDDTLTKADEALRQHAYQTHEFGEFVLIPAIRNLECEIWNVECVTSLEAPEVFDTKSAFQIPNS